MCKKSWSLCHMNFQVVLEIWYSPLSLHYQIHRTLLEQPEMFTITRLISEFWVVNIEHNLMWTCCSVDCCNIEMSSLTEINLSLGASMQCTDTFLFYTVSTFFPYTPDVICLMSTLCGSKSPLRATTKIPLHCTHMQSVSPCVRDRCCDRWQLIANRAPAFWTCRDRWVFIQRSHPAETNQQPSTRSLSLITTWNSQGRSNSHCSEGKQYLFCSLNQGDSDTLLKESLTTYCVNRRPQWARDYDNIYEVYQKEKNEM